MYTYINTNKEDFTILVSVFVTDFMYPESYWPYK